jgi:2-C-methyl-D-erythritol 4-phosphate cytidylyltransferase
VWAIIVAAGSGERFGGPKQFARLDDGTVLDHAIAVAERVVDGVVVVVPSDRATGVNVVPGGATRSESVRCGLARVPLDAEIVVVHDGARPFASEKLYRRVIAAVRDGADGAIPGVPVTDTVKIVDDAKTVVQTLDRSVLVAVQTPQAFDAAALRAAHARGDNSTDDAALVEHAGGRVVVVAGEAENRKITVADDLTWARERLEALRT